MTAAVVVWNLTLSCTTDARESCGGFRGRTQYKLLRKQRQTTVVPKLHDMKAFSKLAHLG